jgi:type IV pilus assembly protein PilW
MNKDKHQAGFTLIEAMIGLALSMIVTSSMVVLMGNSMGSASRIIQMTQLSDELRNTMSMMTRDLRRANYSANAAYCYANSDCGIPGGAAPQTGDITIVNTECMTFNLDRNQDGDASTDDAGAFRLADNGSGIGFIEMWVGGASPDCDAAENVNNDLWMELTDPDFVDITTFIVSDVNSLTGSVTEEGGAILNQRTREVFVQIEGALRLDSSITRRIEDTIKVRNDFLWHPGP